jgi:fatty-acid desaturase
MFEARLSSIRILFLANLLFLGLAPVAWTGAQIGFGVLIYYTFGCLGIVASFHRYYSHNAFQFRSQTTRKIWTLLGHLAGSGSALGWAAIHHRHHAAPDTEEDPHSPIHGFWKTMFLDYGQGDYRSTQTLLKDSYLVFLHKNYFLVLAAYCAVLFTLFGIQGLAFGFCLPSVITLLVSGISNYVSHIPSLGYSPHGGTKAANIWWSSLLNCGEGWHNNHHADPGNFTTKQRWWEFDMTGLAIRLVKT